MCFVRGDVPDESVVSLPGPENQSGPNHFRDGYPLPTRETNQGGVDRVGSNDQGQDTGSDANSALNPCVVWG